MKILVCGGRGYINTSQVKLTLDELKPNAIIQGGARGADLQGKLYGRLNGLPVIEVEANWNYYDKAAGHIRNQWMLDFCSPDLVVAFPGGRGTESMVEKANKAGIEVVRIG